MVYQKKTQKQWSFISLNICFVLFFNLKQDQIYEEVKKQNKAQL